jgi:hypothetical protein
MAALAYRNMNRKEVVIKICKRGGGGKMSRFSYEERPPHRKSGIQTKTLSLYEVGKHVHLATTQNIITSA